MAKDVTGFFSPLQGKRLVSLAKATGRSEAELLWLCFRYSLFNLDILAKSGVTAKQFFTMIDEKYPGGK